MKVCNKIKFFNSVSILLIIFTFASCRTKTYIDKIFNPNIDNFSFNSLCLKDTDLIKSVVQSNNVLGIKAEFENGHIILLSDFYVKEPSGDYPPNFVTIYEYNVSGRLEREKTFINHIDHNNLINESSYEYTDTLVKKITNNTVFYYEIKQKLNGYDMNTENNNEKLKITYRENNKYKKTTRFYNDQHKNITTLLIKNGKETSFSKAELKNEKLIVYFFQEVTKYEGNLIKEIRTYDVDKNGEKNLSEITVIEEYDEHGNWIIAYVYDSNLNLKNICKQDITYLR